MRSTIAARGQTVIPAAIRRRCHLTPADRLEWVADSEEVRVFPVKNPDFESLDIERIRLP